MRAGSDEAPLAYGYEEALRYAVAPDVVRDEDGIQASHAVALLAAELEAQDRTLLDRLDDLTREHGVFAAGRLSVRVEHPSVTSDAMARLRAAPPSRLLGRPVTATHLGDADPPVDAVRLTGDGVRVTARPSGTEPMPTCCLETVVPGGDGDLAAARARADSGPARPREEMTGALAL